MEKVLVSVAAVLVALSLIGVLGYCGINYQNNAVYLQKNCQENGGIWSSTSSGQCVWSKKSNGEV